MNLISSEAFILHTPSDAVSAGHCPYRAQNNRFDLMQNHLPWNALLMSAVQRCNTSGYVNKVGQFQRNCSQYIVKLTHRAVEAAGELVGTKE